MRALYSQHLSLVKTVHRNLLAGGRASLFSPHAPPSTNELAGLYRCHCLSLSPRRRKSFLAQFAAERGQVLFVPCLPARWARSADRLANRLRSPIEACSARRVALGQGQTCQSFEALCGTAFLLHLQPKLQALLVQG